MTVKFQRDAIIYTTNLTALRLHEILRYDILSSIKMGSSRPSHTMVFQSNSKQKFCNALVHNIFIQSQPNFAHVTTVTVLCSMQNFVMIDGVRFKPEHCKFWFNLIEISLMGRAPDLWQIVLYVCIYIYIYILIDWLIDYPAVKTLLLAIFVRQQISAEIPKDT